METVTLPEYTGESPVNYQDIRELVGLALAHEDIEEEVITSVINTIDQAVINNENGLTWPENRSP